LPSAILSGAFIWTQRSDSNTSRNVTIVTPATHDTASAVVAVPAEAVTSGTAHTYISSGTWPLLGLELGRPVLTEEARLAGFTNERGAAGTFRFLTNIMGLWLAQECRRIWTRAGSQLTYADLTARAATVASPNIVIDVDDAGFLRPDDMPDAIVDQLQRTGQHAPDDNVVLVRAILEGLALKYRLAVEQAERLTGTRVQTVHIVGGGSRNALLCQLTADACARAVLAGPAEATAVGKVLVQAIGGGEVRDIAEARSITRASFALTSYEPRSGIDWDERCARLAAHRQEALSAGDLHAV
jgi:rhamnulokinase